MANNICIIILNWNGLLDTIECVESITSSPNNKKFKIFIIDNNSDKNEFNDLKSKFDEFLNINLIINDKNIGFTKAHNKIFTELLKENYSGFFILNNDTTVPSSTINILNNFKVVRSHGMISFKMISYWNQNIIDNAGHKMLSSGEIIPIGHGEPAKKHTEPLQNIGSCAGATLYSPEMLKDIGFFDEYFDTGYEDAELGLRAFIAGYKPTYNPHLVVYHKMGQSIDKVFDYHFSLKAQTNIHYTNIKLVHWQVLFINFIPLVLRNIIITLIHIVFWRPKYLKIQFHAFYNILIRDRKIVWKARKEAKKYRRISWIKLFRKQEFFLTRDIKSFYKFIIKGEKSYFEKY